MERPHSHPGPPPSPTPSNQSGQLPSRTREVIQQELSNVNTVTLTFLIIIADLGMLLFGYEVGASCWLVYAIELLASADDDTGAGLYYKYVSDSTSMLGLMAAMVSLGALVGYMSLLAYGDWIPKNMEISGAAVIYFIGALLQSISDTLSWANATGLVVLLTGRFLYGLGIAMSLHAIPQYIAEVTPKETRGSFGATVEATLMCGMTLGYLIGYLTDTTGWMYTFMGAYILSGIMFLGSLMLPASPIWMYTNNVNTDDILKSLRKLYPDISDTTVAGMKRACELEEKERANRIENKLRSLKTTKSWWLEPLLPYVSPQLRVILLDRTCRRGTTIAVIINMMKILTGQTATMYYLSTIFGYIWTSSEDIEFNSLMYIVSRTLIAVAMIYCINFLGRREWFMLSLFVVFASQFIMYFGFMYSIADLELVTYVSGFGFEVGLGSVSYLVQPEVVPFYVRSSANAVANTILFLFYFLVVFMFPYLLTMIGMDYVFFASATVSLISLYFIVFYLPETQGVAIEEAYTLVDQKFQTAPEGIFCCCGPDVDGHYEYGGVDTEADNRRGGQASESDSLLRSNE
jgi:MFS family permease